jgi:hypothetical protein
VVSSRLVYPEGRAALAMAFRLSRVDESELGAAVGAFEALYDQLDVVEVTEGLARSAPLLGRWASRRPTSHRRPSNAGGALAVHFPN